jgi:hypothetical protein
MDDDEPSGSMSKRSRGHDSDVGPNANEDGTITVAPSPERELSPALPTIKEDAKEVRQVTKGVKEVELEDKKDKTVTSDDAVEGTLKADENAEEKPVEQEPTTVEEAPIQDILKTSFNASSEQLESIEPTPPAEVTQSQTSAGKNTESPSVDQGSADEADVPSHDTVADDAPSKVDETDDVVTEGPTSDKKSTFAYDEASSPTATVVGESELLNVKHSIIDAAIAIPLPPSPKPGQVTA